MIRVLFLCTGNTTRLAAFRAVRDAIAERIEAWLAGAEGRPDRTASEEEVRWD